MDQQTKLTTVPLLWTGGWDSTYRLLVLLLKERRAVQPYYVIDDVKKRPSTPTEREAMQRIREAIQRRHPFTTSLLLPTIEVPLADIKPDPEIFRTYEACLKRGFIGGQYEWLVRLCKQRQLDGLELAIHKDDKARALIADLLDSSRQRLDPRFAGDPRYELFKWFSYPVFDATKVEMREHARELGFDEFMQLTWFCHRPNRGEPCGVCNPCIYTIEEGLADRIPPRGRLRYALRITPRLRRWLTRSPALYMGARALWRRARRVAT